MNEEKYSKYIKEILEQFKYLSSDHIKSLKENDENRCAQIEQYLLQNYHRYALAFWQ